MKRAESTGVLSQEQYGGRSGNISIEVVVLRCLLFEYVRQQIINAVIRSYDTMDEGVIHRTNYVYDPFLVYQSKGKENMSGLPKPTNGNFFLIQSTV